MAKGELERFGEGLGLSDAELNVVRRIGNAQPHYSGDAEKVLSSLYVARSQREAASAFEDAARKQRALTWALVFFTAVQAAVIVLQLLRAG